MKRSLAEWASIAEIIGAAAIVMSLIFVGLQIRQGTAETAANSRALEATIRESMLNADISILQSAMPYSSHITQREPETEEERGQQRIYIFMVNRSRENYWNQHSNGMLDDETYLSYRESYINFLVQSDFALAIFESGRNTFVPGFVAEIEEELAKRGRISISE